MEATTVSRSQARGVSQTVWQRRQRPAVRCSSWIVIGDDTINTAGEAPTPFDDNDD